MHFLVSLINSTCYCLFIFISITTLVQVNNHHLCNLIFSHKLLLEIKMWILQFVHMGVNNSETSLKYITIFNVAWQTTYVLYYYMFYLKFCIMERMLMLAEDFDWSCKRTKLQSKRRKLLQYPVQHLTFDFSFEISNVLLMVCGLAVDSNRVSTPPSSWFRLLRAVIC